MKKLDKKIDRAIPFVFVGGILGSILRYGIFTSLDVIRNNRAIMEGEKGYSNLIDLIYYLPLASIFVNLIGSFILAFIARCLLGRIKPNTYKLLATGLIGSFTTFSTFSRDFCQLALDGHTILALIYAFISMAGGISMAILGNILGKKVNKC